ncbi:MAG: Rieske (2Fe-2S) protein [Vicinamibacteria bacterium]|jgi:Rieske Fe-S protein|nr:Rieske (2Fe-2S) protein [Vicinamibacteria bacterium]
MRDTAAGKPCDRRTALGGALGALGAIAVAACGPEPESAPPAAEFALDELPPGGRRLLVIDGDPVEVTRTESGLVARSLVCTHFGCPLRWDAAKTQYVCPCHEGAFGADGRPVAGPPVRPLRVLPVRVEAGRVRVEPAPS